MLQKFKKLSFVKIGNDYAIIDGTHSQIFGDTDIKAYSVFILDKTGGSIVDKRAWIPEEDIVLITDEPVFRDVCELKIEQYNFRDSTGE